MSKTIRESVKALLPFLSEDVDGWNMLDIIKLDRALVDAGFDTEMTATKYGPCLVVTHDDHEGEMNFYGSTFKERFERFKYSGPFWLIDPDVEGEVPQWRLNSNDKEPKAFNANGIPKAKNFYGILQSVEQVPWGDPWLDGSEKGRNLISVNGGNISAILAKYLTGENPGAQYMGRGFAEQACSRAIHEFAEGVNV